MLLPSRSVIGGKEAACAYGVACSLIHMSVIVLLVQPLGRIARVCSSVIQSSDRFQRALQETE